LSEAKDYYPRNNDEKSNHSSEKLQIIPTVYSSSNLDDFEEEPLQVRTWVNKYTEDEIQFCKPKFPVDKEEDRKIHYLNKEEKACLMKKGTYIQNSMDKKLIKKFNITGKDREKYQIKRKWEFAEVYEVDEENVDMALILNQNEEYEAKMKKWEATKKKQKLIISWKPARKKK
jgi:hypothetical protein